MNLHLIGPRNLITRYFRMKTVRFESHEYTFSDEIIIFLGSFRFVHKSSENISKSCCFGLLNRKRDIPVRSR